MTQKKRILFVLYDNFVHIDLVGPSSVFDTSNIFQRSRYYELRYLSTEGGQVSTFGGPDVITEPLNSVRPSARDSIVIVGGGQEAIDHASRDMKLTEWVSTMAARVERVCSVCSGAFVLGASGLLDGKDITTHWVGLEQLQQLHPHANVLSDALYVVDEQLWTSAGATAGFDMSLEMVRRDLGVRTMSEVAKHLVIYAHRPGGQSQFSELINVQSSYPDKIIDVIAWAENNLTQGLKVADLAAYSCMSERTFYRKFSSVVGKTPSKFLEGLKLYRAKTLLETGMPIKKIAGAVGFQSESGFRSAFENEFQLTPSLYRQLHSIE